MTVYILNLFDLMATLYAMSIGVLEFNPLMQNVPFMIFYKVFVIGALCLWLKRSTKRIAILGLKLCTILYATLALWHIYGFVQP